MSENAFQRVLERIYTLLGSEFSLLVVVPDPLLQSANTSARELVLASRVMSSECVEKRPVAKSSCSVIRGSVVRIDLNSNGADIGTQQRSSKTTIVPFGPEDIKQSMTTRTAYPVVIAFVGVEPSVITRLGDEPLRCRERPELRDLATGGYMVLESREDEKRRHIAVEVCLPPPTTGGFTGRSAGNVNPPSSFLVGTEVVDETRKVVYALRVAPGRPAVASSPAQQLTEYAAASSSTVCEPTRAIRSARWRSVSGNTPPPAPTPPPQIPVVEWESLVQKTVERELSKLLLTPGAGITEIPLGDGLTARLWPQLILEISQSRDWHAVFTHQSVDPTPHANYESYETLGDKVLSLALIRHLLSGESRGTAADSDSLTDIHKEILSETRQPVMAVSMGLDYRGLIRATVIVDCKMLEDVLEAFFGCLFTVANRTSQGSSQGLPIAEAMFVKLLKEVYPDLDIWSITKDPPTVLDQLFQRLSWGKPIMTYNDKTGITTIRLPREAIEHLTSIGPPLRSDILAAGPKATDIKKSKKAAAEAALAALKSNWNIDTKYVSMIVRKRLMKDEHYAKAHQEALEVASRHGSFTDVYVARRAKHHNQLYAVMGIRPNGTEAQLHIYRYNPAHEEEPVSSSSSARVQAYITALREYVAKSSGGSSHHSGTSSTILPLHTA